MIQKATMLKVIDNTGAKKAKCIHLYQGYRRRYARMGDLIKVSIQNLKITQQYKKLKTGVVRGIVLCTKKEVKFHSGYSCSFSSNNIALFKDKTNKLLGNRILTPAHRSFRKTRFLRVSTIAGGNII